VTNSTKCIDARKRGEGRYFEVDKGAVSNKIIAKRCEVEDDDSLDWKRENGKILLWI